MNRKIWLGLTGLCVLFVLGGVWVFAATSGDALSYYPVNKPGNKWEYQGNIANKYTETLIYGVVKPEGNTLMVGIAVNGKKAAVEYYQESDQGLMRTQEVSGNEMIKFSPPQVVLPAKMEAGIKWDWTSDNGKIKDSGTVSAQQGKITVPAGSFDTLLVSSEGVDASGVNYTDKTWYAKGVGMVKEELNYGGALITRQLSRYQVN